MTPVEGNLQHSAYFYQPSKKSVIDAPHITRG